MADNGFDFYAVEPPAEAATRRTNAAAKLDMDYLEALQRESRRRTGQELSPELAAALILRRTALKSSLA